MKEKLTIQLITACVVTVAGLVLLFWGCAIDPQGQIHDSLLVAFGETMTFAGALFGVDYSYKFKIYNRRAKDTNKSEQEGNE